jgi:superfamily I DNA and/or RNA helicase
MAKPIAELVSRVFYPVAGAEPEPDGLFPGRLASGREIGPLPLRAPAPLRGKSLVWLDTSADPDCATDFPTWSNPGEAKVVADLIGRIVPAPRPHRDGYSADPLAVLTPYRRQADYLRDYSHVKPHVYTVHAFQGREADIVVVSLVRSALRGTEPTERPWESLGHLSRRELINVMVSRARQLLVLVGNYDHFAAFSQGEAKFWGEVCRAVELYGSIVPSGSLRG